jgi:Uma2 family endonuclease
MAMSVTALQERKEERTVLLPPRCITFDEFVDMFGEDDDVELIDGVVIRRMAAQGPHETLFGWLYVVLWEYTETKDLGQIYGSRTAVEIHKFRGRLPDLLFVRRRRRSIVRRKGVYGAPDLIVEIISPNDRPSDIVALESDYCNLGVGEIWFIDQPHDRVRVLRKGRKSYIEEELTEGILRSKVVEGFWLDVDWLFQTPRPKVRDVLKQLLEENDKSH